MTHRARKILLYSCVTAAILIVAALIGADYYVRTLGPRLRAHVEKALEQRFDADVDLAQLHMALLPQPQVVGVSLAIHHKKWPGEKPLISMTKFTARTGFWDLLFQRDTVRTVDIEGLQIYIPPRRSDIKEGLGGGKLKHQPHPERLRFVIGTLIANGAVLQIEPKKAGSDPLRFDIEKLTMRTVGPGQPMAFQAALLNAKPPGLIDTEGNFGPWVEDDPRSTEVNGNYVFKNADLGVFKGISGVLSSTGTYSGVLEEIKVDGQTQTPQFALKRGGAPVNLTTVFHAVVDGTNGDTILNSVDAHFLQSEFLCQGGVVKEQLTDSGKTVRLDAATKQARMEDILQLVMGDQQPILTGAVDFKTQILIPPGEQDVLDKLKLKGQFKISSARFASKKVDRSLATLSDRARGITKKEQSKMPPQSVASNLLGQFRLADGSASFSELHFDVPGAQIRLHGKYNLVSEKIDMAGVFRMQATLADTQSGIKHWLLKPIDPLFEKNGAGFQVPLDIGGTRKEPVVGVTVFHHKFKLK